MGATLLLLPASATPGAGHATPVPILMYHVVAVPPASAPFPELYVPPATFAAQMRWLAGHGYHAVTLWQVYRRWRDGTPLPAHPIVLSFDDGYRAVYRNAVPVLHARGWPAVLNLEVRNERGRWGLSPAHVSRMIGSGWELDSHTIDHPDLTTLGAAALRREVTGSRVILRRQFHVPVRFFCYPSGRYDDAVIRAVQAAGYLGATSTRYGLARPDELWTLARVRVNGSDGTSGLASKLASLGA